MVKRPILILGLMAIYMLSFIVAKKFFHLESVFGLYMILAVPTGFFISWIDGRKKDGKK